MQSSKRPATPTKNKVCNILRTTTKQSDHTLCTVPIPLSLPARILPPPKKYLEELRTLLIVHRDKHGHARQGTHRRLLRVHLRDVGDTPGQDMRGAVVAVLETELVGLVPQSLHQDSRVSFSRKNSRRGERAGEQSSIVSGEWEGCRPGVGDGNWLMGW